MASWGDGYVTDVPYVSGYHAETVPIWMSTAATLLGYAVPGLTHPFRYLDLGCGRGVTALVIAATTPHADVWAVDFNPAHVGSGRDIARRVGLSNIHFVEASFDDLIHNPPKGLTEVDYLTAHGVVSWISLENRRHLFSAIGRFLSPGGIAQVSYNVPTGWAGMRPIRKLMRLLADASPKRTDLALADIFKLLEDMKSAGAKMFQDHPTLGERVTRLRTADVQYVSHELLNRDWHPVMFPEVAAAMADIKCDYIGSAGLQDNFGGFTVPAGMAELFGQIHDTTLREAMRDIAGATQFRRDLYQRGPRRMSSAEHRARLDAMRFVRTFRPVADPFVVQCPLGPLNVDPVRFLALLEFLKTGPATMGQLRARFIESAEAGLEEVVALLVGSGYLAPAATETPDDAAKQAAARLNEVHAVLFEQGYAQPYLAYPALGGAWQADGVEILALDELRRGRPAEESSLAYAVLHRITSGGRNLYLNATTLPDPAAVMEIITGKIRELLAHLPAMRGLGLIDSPETLTESVSRPESERP